MERLWASAFWGEKGFFYQLSREKENYYWDIRHSGKIKDKNNEQSPGMVRKCSTQIK